MGQNVHRKKREKFAESKYDFNYFDTAFDYRDKVAKERKIKQNFVGQRWNLYDTDRFWNDHYHIPPDHRVSAAEEDVYNDLEVSIAQIDPYLNYIDGFRILIIGCGLSGLARELKTRGFTNITNLDCSTALVDHMLFPADLGEGIDAVCGDSTNLYMFPDNWFDLIVDKAMLDVMFTKPFRSK